MKHFRLITGSGLEVLPISVRLRLFLSALSVLFMAIGCARSRATNEFDAVLMEAQAGWAKFNRLYTHCTGRWITKETIYGEARRPTTRELKKKGAQLVVITNTPSGPFAGSTVIGVNKDYAFRLERKRQPHWSVAMLRPREDDEARRALSDIMVNQYGPTQLYRDPLEIAVKKPYFKVTAVRRDIQLGSHRYVEIDFDYEHPYVANSPEPFNWVQGGTLTLWPDNFWVIKKAVLKMQQGGGFPSERFIAEINYEYDQYELGVRYPTGLREIYRGYADDFQQAFDRPVTVDSETVFEMTTVKASELADREFRLSAFGLADIEHLAAKRRSKILPLFIGLAIFVLAVWLWKRRGFCSWLDRT